MAYGGEQTISTGWGGAAGRGDEPELEKVNRILTLRYQISASEQMAPPDTTVETANTQKLTVPANTLQSGDRLKLRAWGKVPSANGTDTLTARLRAASVSGLVLAEQPAYNADANDYVRLEADMHLETKGAAAASKLHSAGKAKATGEAEAETYVVDDTSLDTTAALDFLFTQDWSANSASNRFKLYELELLVFRTRRAWG